MRNVMKLLCLLIAIVSLNSLHAQTTATRDVTGTVTDSKGNPLPGVTIQLKGSKTIVTTNEQGKFTIKAPTSKTTLSASYVGFADQDISVTGNSTIAITLVEANQKLEDVVVVGYGTQKKKDLTGSIASVSHDQLNLGGVTSNAAQAIQGRASGVQVSQTSAAPGGQTTIRIRGGNSIKSTNEPLYIVDGFPSETGIDINPGDIEDIQVLKDASATAIYGSRGANGVIMITTKRGKAGKTIVSYEGYYGMQNFTKEPAKMTGKQFMDVTNAKAAEQGNPPEYSDAELNSGVNTDWFKLGTQTGRLQNHDINIRAGSEKTRISISGNYFGQDGILKHTNFNRYSGRVNVDQDVSKDFKVGANIYSSRSNSDYKTYDGNIVPSNVVYGILNGSPAIKPYNDDGTYYRRKGRDNPLAWLLEPTNDRFINKLSANAYGEYQFIEGLSLRLNIGTEQVTTKEGTYIPTTLVDGEKVKGKASINNLQATRNLLETYFTYKKKIAGFHNINAMAGFSMQKDLSDANYTQVQKFTSDQYLYNNLGGGAERIASTSSKIETKMASFFGRLNYSYKDKYLATFTLRADGSSNFAESHRWGYFPSGSLAWRLSDESFIRDMNVFSNLKLRASYGITGNDRIPPYSYMATFGPTNVTLDGDNSYGGIVATRAANPDLKWESTAQFNVGLDMGFANGRINATLDFYKKKTNDLLLDIPIGQWWGFSSQTVNAGSVQNQGVELSINTENINTKDFRWNSSFNIAYNKQKCVNLGGRPYIITQTANPDGSVGAADFTKLEPGKELSTIFGYVYDGVVKTGEKYNAQPASVAGDPKFKDLNGDGVIDANDRAYLGNTTPHWVGGFNNDLAYKGFELGIFFQGALGYNLYNMNRLLLETYTGVDALNRWTPQNNNTDVPRDGYFGSKYGGYINSRFVENASYVRCKLITLGYNLPWTKNVIKNFKIYVSMQNAFTITSYSGTDPEVNTNGAASTASANTANMAAGLDFNAFPAFRTLTFGAKITF
ncbi:TonB-dependent receptor [Chitinophagaceae bacterium DXS]|nr:TonB-dependent receptor [Chitinophagaceae bacterium DXS]